MLDYWERRERLFRKSPKKEKQEEIRPEQQIRLASMIEESIVDGPGMRFVLFTQGCPHRCPGCHNPQTHALNGGTMVSFERVLERYDRQPHVRGITFSGGEPFLQAGLLAKVAEAVHQRGGDVVVYTGHQLERLQELAKGNAGILALLGETDLLIDGRFVQEKRCLEAPFVGSSNQRLLALSLLGNLLLNDIPVLPNGPAIERVTYC